MTASAVSDRDGALAVIAGVCALGSLALLTINPRLHSTDASPLTRAVATVTVASAELRRRPEKQLGWYDAPAGAAINEHDALFVPPGGEAKITFTDGSTLELDERTLVVVELPSGSQAVALRQGSLTGSTGSAGLDVLTPQGRAHLAANAAAHVEITPGGDVELLVQQGQATVGATRLEAGEHAALRGGNLQPASTWPAQLLEPAANQRRFFRGVAPELTLRWQPSAPAGSRVQLARDRLFSFVVVDSEVARLDHLRQQTGAGVFWWRLLDGAGRPQSEARRFSVLEDTPTLTLTPREGDVVTASESESAFFAWTQVRGVSRYQLEVAATPDFATLAFSATVDGTSLRAPLPLAEGWWHWRVRVADEQRGNTEASASASFRLIHKPIPEAPQLLAPEIEVAPSTPLGAGPAERAK